MCQRIYFTFIINKHFNFCCFRALAYTTLDRLCAVFPYNIFICKTGPVDLYGNNTVMAVDQTGFTTCSVQATRGQQPNVNDAVSGAFITVITMKMYQSVAATVSATLQQPSIQFPADKFFPHQAHYFFKQTVDVNVFCLSILTLRYQLLYQINLLTHENVPNILYMKTRWQVLGRLTASMTVKSL